MWSSGKLIATTLALASMAFGQGQGGEQSITAHSGFDALQSCARRCFMPSEAYIKCTASDYLGSSLGCDAGCNTIAPNDCYCRPDKQTNAHVILSKCIDFACRSSGDPEVDITSAWGVYEGYCTSLGYTDAEATTDDSSPTPIETDSGPTRTGDNGDAVTTETTDGGSGSSKGVAPAGLLVAGLFVPILAGFI